MAKEKNAMRGQGQYGDVVARLQEIVESLEKGELSLEDSLERFQEGITLVKQGESILGDAEKRIEQLLSEDGRTAPLKLSESSEPSKVPVATGPVRKVTPVVAPSLEDDDVPF